MKETREQKRIRNLLTEMKIGERRIVGFHEIPVIKMEDNLFRFPTFRAGNPIGDGGLQSGWNDHGPLA